jgi:hypothetical protein
MLDELWMLIGVVAVMLIMALIYYLQIRYAVPRRPNKQLEALAFCARCVHRHGDLCTHPGSPVFGQACGPVCIGDLACSVREVRRGLDQPQAPGLWAGLWPGVHRRSTMPDAGGAAVRLYAVIFDCPHCGKDHLVSSGLMLSQEPGQAGTVAQLWPEGGYPPTLAGVLNDRIWCDGQAEYVAMDPERVIVTLAAGD